MKKKIMALLLAAAMSSVLLAACGGEDETGDGGAAAPTYDDSLLGELYSEEGEYSDEHGNTLRYCYHVPRILSETAVAAALNQEIAQEFGRIVEEQKSMMAARASLTCLSITWESYWSGSLLSLVVKGEMEGGTVGSSVYHYDFFGGKQMTSEELVARCGLSEEKFLRAARYAAAEYFDTLHSEALDEGGAGMAALYAERRAWTLSDENINARTPLYLDGEILHMIVPVGTFAGADSEEVDLIPNIAEREYGSAEAEDRFVHAALENGTLCVWFEETEESEWYAENFRFDYDSVYFAEGLYSEYTDVFIGSMGQGYFPYIFLLTDKGRVEYVNLLEGLTAEFLCCGGPIGGARDVKALEMGTTEEEYGTYETVFAVNSAGEKYDLSGAVSDMDWVVPQELLGTWSAEVEHDTADEPYTSDYVLTLADGGGITVYDIVSGLGIYNEYVGQIHYLGTNGEGMVFGYHLNERASSVRYGAFSLLRQDEILRVKAVTGEDIFDAPVGRATVFAWSF